MDYRKETRIKHYSSTHKILLVGEGDFSFSKCLASAFGTAINMTATSLDNRANLMVKYSRAIANVEELKNLGCTIIHGVSAHTMKHHSKLSSELFDRIVFNFPHSGFSHRPEHSSHMIKRHRKLVRGFLRNAREMLNKKGQIHVTHKTAYPFSEWNIEELAEEEGLRLIKRSPFYISEYDGYVNKKGDGRNCNKSFPIRDCCTFKFVYARLTEDTCIRIDGVCSMTSQKTSKSIQDLIMHEVLKQLADLQLDRDIQLLFQPLLH